MSNPPVTPQPSVAARAHWTIYLPTLVVALVWAGIYGWAHWHDPALDGLASVALFVEALGVPLLLFSAVLRARVLTVELHGQQLYIRTGVLRARDVGIGLSEIAHVRVRHSIPQQWLGGGALDVTTLSGDRFLVTDLDNPGRIAAAIMPEARSEFGHEERLK